MTVAFGEQNHLVNDQAAVEHFLQNDIDDDLDVKAAANEADRYVMCAQVIEGWHPDSNGDQHLTVEVWLQGQQAYTAHVYANGQITAYS